MGLFNWSYSPKQEDVLNKEYDELNHQSELTKMVEEKALVLLRASKDDWEEFKTWKSMSFIDRIIYKVNLRTPTSESFLLGIAWAKEEIKANLSGSKARSGEDIQERLINLISKAKTPFTVKQLGSLMKDLFLFNTTLKKDESAYKFILGKFVEELAFDNSKQGVPEDAMLKPRWQKRNKKAKRNEAIKHPDYSAIDTFGPSITNSISAWTTNPNTTTNI
jgi:hypothetical protein